MGEAHNYVLHEQTRPDVVRTARLAAESSGDRQFVHAHPRGAPCVPACEILDPPQERST